MCIYGKIIDEAFNRHGKASTKVRWLKDLEVTARSRRSHSLHLANNGPLWLDTALVSQSRGATVGRGWPVMATGGQGLATSVESLA